MSVVMGGTQLVAVIPQFYYILVLCVDNVEVDVVGENFTIV